VIPGPRILRLTLAVLLGQAPLPARAHPHVFIDGGVDFLFDADGRLAELQVTWIYDAMSSLLMLEDLGIDAAQPLRPRDRPRLTAYQTEWQPGFDGDSYLLDGERRIGLSGPLDPDADLQDGQVVVTFTRSVETPFRPGPATVAEVYDPTYFTAYTVTAEPKLGGTAEGCRAEVEPFRPTASLLAIQEKLSAVPIDQVPEEDLGRLFADKVHITCD